MKPSPLPSPAFQALLSTRHEPALLGEMSRAITAGAWAFDANERHPVSHKSVLGHLFEDYWRYTDEDWGAFLRCLLARGFDPKAPEPDGKSAFQTARKKGDWALLESFVAQGWEAEDSLGVKQEKDEKTLSGWLVDFNARSVDAIASELLEGGEDLSGLSPRGIPWGLLPITRNLPLSRAFAINGRAMGGSNASLDDAKDIAEGFTKSAAIAKAVLDQTPSPVFSLWVWASLSQAIQWLPKPLGGVQTNKKALQLKNSCEKSCLLLERALHRHQKKHGWEGRSIAEAFAHQARTQIGLMGEALTVDAAALPRISTLAVAALTQYAERLATNGAVKEETHPVLGQAFGLAAGLLEDFPRRFFHDEFAPSSWKSGMYYALRPSVESALRAGEEMPSFVSKPWSTIVLLLDGDTSSTYWETTKAWVLGSGEMPDMNRLKPLMGDALPALIALEAARLEVSFSHSRPLSSKRGPRF